MNNEPIARIKINELLKEACELLKVHPNTLRHWDEKGILKAVRIGQRKDRRYRLEDIKKHLEENNK